MLTQLAKLWNCSPDRAEDALRSDADHARRVLSRRQLFGVAAALACPLSEPHRVFSFSDHELSTGFPKLDDLSWYLAPSGSAAEQIVARQYHAGMEPSGDADLDMTDTQPGK